MTDLTEHLTTDDAGGASAAGSARHLSEVSLPAEERDGWDGVTKPRTSNAGPRFLTDVIVQLGRQPQPS